MPRSKFTLQQYLKQCGKEKLNAQQNSPSEKRKTLAITGFWVLF